jgi:hypothetical protein
MKLNSKDYKNILKFYKVDISALSSKAIKEKAEHFLAVKLCKCIKNIRGTSTSKADTSKADTSKADTSKADTSKADTSKADTSKADASKADTSKGEKRAIAVCYNSVITKKKLKIFKFTCKKKVKLLPKKGTRKIFVEKLGA